MSMTFEVLDYRHAVYWLLRHSATKYGKVLPFHLPLRQRPHVLEVELTNDCDIDCSFCYRNKMTRSVGYMDPDVFKKIVDEISEWSYRVVRLVGLGEPALHPQFADFMHYLREKRVPVEVTTNGKLFQRFSPDEVLDFGLHTIGVSVDGYDAASYNKIRRGGDHDRLFADVRTFFEARTAQKLAHPWVVIRNVILPDAEFKNPQKIDAFKKRWADQSDRIRFNTLEKSKEEIYDTGRVCDDIFYTMHIRWNGLVPLCGYHQLYATQEWMGDVAEVPLEKIWHMARWDEVRDNHLRGNLASSEFCKKCFQQQCQNRVKSNQQAHNAQSSSVLSWLEKQAWRLVK